MQLRQVWESSVKNHPATDYGLLCGSELHRDLKPVQGLLAGGAVDATQCPPER
jgi:hypothetical protein